MLKFQSDLKYPSLISGDQIRKGIEINCRFDLQNGSVVIKDLFVQLHSRSNVPQLKDQSDYSCPLKGKQWGLARIEEPKTYTIKFLFEGEYSNVFGVEAGMRFLFSIDNPGDWINIFDSNGNLLVSGVTPLEYTSTVSGRLQVLWTLPSCLE